jgi:hypothetical protein
MATQTVSFSLDTERDADLATWLNKHDRRARSAAIREKLRAGIHQDSSSLADVLAELREIKRMLRSGATAQANAGQDDDLASAAVKGKLANLGL